MKCHLQIGEKWGCVEVIGMDTIRDNPEDFRDHHRIYRLRCKCGEDFEIDSLQWEGKRRTSDCGCGISSDPRDMPVVISVYVPLRLRDAIESCAREQRVSRNRWISDILANIVGEL
jgi:hypothetical protein